MTQKHDHILCEHVLVHCIHCDVVHCKKCKREWGEQKITYIPYTYPNYPDYPWYPTWGDNTAGQTISGETYLVNDTGCSHGY